MKKSELLITLQYLSFIELRTKEYKVLLYLLPKLANLEFGDFYSVSQFKIADDIRIPRSDVSKALKNLVVNKVLKRQSSKGPLKNNYSLGRFYESDIDYYLDISSDDD